MKSQLLHFLLFLSCFSFHAKGQQKPCEQYDFFHQLDFWIGDWRVENTDGTLAGFNKIEAILDECVIMENWTGSGVNRGKSFNYYNFQTKKWHQQWVDNFGQTLTFEGDIKDNVAYYKGTSIELNGKKVFHRLTISKVNDNEVNQLWEQSYDNEKWETVFEGKYIRQNIIGIDKKLAQVEHDSLYYNHWVGEWFQEVDGELKTTPTFVIKRALYNASFEEYWMGAGGNFSMAWRAWDTRTQTWGFAWMSSDGLFQNWEGKKVDGVWYMYKIFIIQDQEVLSRQAFIPQDETTLIRTSEHSKDNGKTWTLRFREVYKKQ